MRSSTATVNVFIAGLLSAALLCACGGGPTASTPQLSSFDVRSALKAQPDKSPNFGRWIYSAHLYDNDLKIYEQNGSSLALFGEFTSGVSAPQGTKVTPNGWWYATNSGDSTVRIYKSKKSGPVGPFPALQDYGQLPVNVDALPNRRLVAVSNQGAGSVSGSVSIYLNRQTNPSRTLTYGNTAVVGMGVAISHQGDCYWSFNGSASGGGTIVEFPGCNGSGTQVLSGIPKVGGIIFDQSDNLYYIDQTSGIYKCQKTSKCKSILGLSSVGLVQPYNMNFDYKGKEIWVADLAGYIVELANINGIGKGNKQIKVTRFTDGGPTDPPFGIGPAPGQ
jgi:hypothetical protein